MGRTIPSYRIASEMRRRWRPFRTALGKKERKMFDDRKPKPDENDSNKNKITSLAVFVVNSLTIRSSSVSIARPQSDYVST